jgi:hypothetical protein
MNGHVVLGAVLCTIFWICASVIPNHVILMITNSLILAASVAVSIAYVPVALKTLKDDSSPRMQHIAIGIAYAWVGAALWRIMIMFWLMSGQKAELLNNDIMAMIQGIVFLGACYHLTSPGALGFNMPSARWLVLGVVCGIGALMAVLLILFTPNTEQWAEQIIPWLPR